MAKQTIDGVTSPEGGFQQGGWYSGRQYWGGTLSAPGVINSQSNQSGAGQAVSNEVVKQTNPNNVAYIAQQQQSTGNNSSNVQASLDSFGSSLFGAADSAPSRGVQTFDQIANDLKASGLLPSTPAPTAPSLVDQFNTLTQAKGVDAIQASITDLKSQQDAIASQLQVTKTAERGKPVAQNVIEGRVTQEQQVAQDQYDFIGRQLARKQDELTSTLGNIKMIMDFTQQDYTNASASYNTQFDHAITTFNLIHGIQQDQKTDAQRAVDNARANAQILINTVTAGNLSLQNLGPDQKAQLNKLEVQSGLPVGFFQAIKMDAKANIISTTTDNGVTQVLMRNADGTISVQNYGTKTSGAGTAANKAALNSTTVQILSLKANSYGDVSGQVFRDTRNAYIQDGGTASDFNAQFGSFADTNRGDFLSQYGFPNPAKPLTSSQIDPATGLPYGQ